MNAFGAISRESGHRRVPAPPDRITGMSVLPGDGGISGADGQFEEGGAPLIYTISANAYLDGTLESASSCFRSSATSFCSVVIWARSDSSLPQTRSPSIVMRQPSVESGLNTRR